MSRLLVGAAVACLLLGALLGVWGWGERDAARDRVRAEAAAARAEAEAEVFGGEDRAAVACAAVTAAAELDPGRFDVFAPPGVTVDPDDPSDPVPSSEVDDPGSLGSLEIGTLVALLSPETVDGVFGLDSPETRDAMDRLRIALETSERSGTEDVAADPEVRAAADELRALVSFWC